MYGNNYAQPQQQWGQAPYQGYQPGYQNGPPPVNYGQHPSQGGQGGQWGAPPQQQQYGGPPQGQFNGGGYGGPPQQQQWNGGNQGFNSPAPGMGGGYGSAPPQGQYGAPSQPPQQFGAPSPYGGAPQQQGGFTPGQLQGPIYYLGAPIPAPPPAVPTSTLSGYNAQFDAERIRKATKGFGTDEKTIIDTLAPLDAFQMEVLSRTYEQTVGRPLKTTLEKELSGWLEYVLVLISLGPLAGDVHLLHRACKGAGTHEDLLNEILLGRSNQEMFMLKELYQRTHHKDLAQVVRGELSMKTESRLFNMALSGQRDESPYLDHKLVQQDVQTLYRAGPGKIGTDEIAICGILCSRSPAHLRAVAQAFHMAHRTELSKMIKSEFSGHMQDALYYIARGAEMDGDGIVRDVELLQAAMAGMGTKDERLCYRLARAHWNRPRFNSIKNQYQGSYNKSLRRAVEGETTGKYEKALVAIIEQN
ncbi:hypothetical protein I350_04294 [Cryptococcus amylolentus CBS 6273]|uniref:Annexin n=1 Tax=Cryptococcus amylolentus CBS 6273 TaxID=1296118 RepID=A0A1E3K1N1_9TREE|nr:hypothetical protein I350_04294 [Cryptococcus amylolentus CBS 6273]